MTEKYFIKWDNCPQGLSAIIFEAKMTELCLMSEKASSVNPHRLVQTNRLFDVNN